MLEKESNIVLDSQPIKLLKDAIDKQQWDDAERCLMLLDIKRQEDTSWILYLLRREKYFDCILKQDLQAALHVLQKELSPLSIVGENLHDLSYYLLHDEEDLDYIIEEATRRRRSLIDEIGKVLGNDALFPRGRLHDLIKQAISKRSPSSSSQEQPIVNLYGNYENSLSQPVWKTEEILRGHKDQVWCVKYSRDGQLLATGDASGQILIWRVSDNTHKLHGTIFTESNGIRSLDWCYDSQLLLVVTNQNASVYNLDGELTMTFIDDFVCAYWLPNSKEFICGCLNGRVIHARYIPTSPLDETQTNGMEMDTVPAKIWTWRFATIDDIIILPQGDYIVVFDQKRTMTWLNLTTRAIKQTILQTTNLISGTVSQDGKYLVINCSSTETPLLSKHSTQMIKLFDLTRNSFIEQLIGYRQSRYVIRSDFAGNDSEYIVSGSEDACVYIWNRSNGDIVAQLKGHTAVVNSVSCLPNSTTFATVSDDHTIRIWRSTMDQK